MRLPKAPMVSVSALRAVAVIYPRVVGQGTCKFAIVDPMSRELLMEFSS